MRPLALALVLTALVLAPAAATALAPHADAAVADARCALRELLGDPADDAEGLVADACVGLIRPGAVLKTPWGRCTMAWVADGSDGRTYVATAGHCAAKSARVETAGVGVFGTMVARAANGPGDDWGWIRVDASKEHLVVAELCRWGGPVKAEPATKAGPVLQYGWGTGWQADEKTRARVLVAADSHADEWPVHYGSDSFREGAVTLAGPGAGGDSGSPFMTMDGAPLGILTHGYVLPPGLRPDPVPPHVWPIRERQDVTAAYGTAFATAVAEGEAALGVTLTLRTTDAVAPLIG